ncbi:MAG: GNAT family N-acetyltransferase, partial [Burkholderiaceae bacterium]|nr:GNAT family N-acetyltransferase [Burkholderiaceae bacterium]
PRSVELHGVVGGERRRLEISEAPLPGGGTVGTAIDVTAREELRAEMKRVVAAHADVLVALEGDQIVGTVTVLEPGTPTSEISQPGEIEFRFMAVHPDRWGRGVARALVEAVIARAGDRPLACCVIEGNEPAFALYRATGFDRVPERDWEPAPGVSLRAMRRLAP